MKVKRHIVLIIAIFILSISSLVFFYGNIAVSLFAACNDMNISYRQLNTIGMNEFVFKGLKAVEKRRGMGLSSEDARIKLIFDKSSWANPTAELNLNEVRLIKRGIEKEVSYGNIDSLISVPFSGILRYNTVTGKVRSIKNGISVKDFLASGDEVRFSFDGTLTHDSNINADISIYFAKNILGKIPVELTSMALKDNDGQWKSLSVKLEGDLSKPAIKVTGKMFRLNIGVK